MKFKSVTALMVAVFLIGPLVAESADYSFDRYHPPAEVFAFLKQAAAANPGISKIHSLGRSAKGVSISLIEIGPEAKKSSHSFPAVFVVANLDGLNPLATEASIFLLKTVIGKAEARKDKTWYILPLVNPDAAGRFFKKPLFLDGRNGRPHNDDMDDAADEDGFEDLDKNGLITSMRVKAPDGVWMPVSGKSLLMKRADPNKGEKGIYRLISEGIDNDGDGKYNEDGPGGVNIASNFPHLFKHFTPDGGAWAGSEQESFNLIRFIIERPEIALTFVFGDSNFCMIPPQGGRRGAVDTDQLKLPSRIGEMLGVDTERTYSMKEIVELVQGLVPPGMKIDESMIASFLGLGAVVNPLPQDLAFYGEISKKYKEYLKKNKMDGKRLDPPKARDGSFELWSYYQLGLPSFSLDFWSLPKPEEKKKDASEITAEKLEQMSKDDFLALGEDKIGAFLKSVGAPDNFNAKMVMNLLETGKTTPAKMAQMLKQMPKPSQSEGGASPRDEALKDFSDKVLDGRGLIDWKPFNHPTLGPVEIGGEVPFASSVPPAKMINSLLKGQVPWVLEVTDHMARIKIDKTEIKPLGQGLYRVNVWIENSGYIPYPTYMGRRNRKIAPLVLALGQGDFTILEGKRRAVVQAIDGLKSHKVSWIIQSGKPISITLDLISQNAWKSQVKIRLGGAK